ncbi:GNAT family N-acetyltransferase [Tepidicaulis sp. LMO-SS28]|uniref:GNAT family N-acetyltransferase n=1 Tax=Tepidicaulis sp. LMO-SS28 TaxID=3447455 RepID=UPI003EDF5C88
MQIEPIGPDHKILLTELFEAEWGGPDIISRGRIKNALELPGFTAFASGKFAGAVTYVPGGDEWEVLTLNSLTEGTGVGSLLLNHVLDQAKSKKAKRLWLVTTNDNIPAIRFYQRSGWNFCALHKDAVVQSRKLKPQIPLTGHEDIPIRHELEFELWV